MLVLHARLRFGAYGAGDHDDPRVPEYPPRPARLFCALVASGPTDSEWAALRWLERQQPPDVLAPPVLDRAAHEIFVPTNDIKSKSPNLPGRVNGSRTKPVTYPAGPEFALVWVEASPPPDVRAGLDALARRVGYLGRSTASPALWFSETEPTSEHLVRYEPADTGPTLQFRVPYEGYADRLAALHQRGARPWEANRTQGYRIADVDSGDRPEAEAVAGPFGRLLIFRFPKPVHLHARKCHEVTNQLRAAVMSLLPNPIPAAVSGHMADESPHVAYLALPNVGHLGNLPDGPRLIGPRNAHARGQLLALAIAIPTGEDELAYRLYEALVLGAGPKGRHLDHLVFGQAGQRFDLVADQVGTGPAGSRGATWTRPSTLWATATPVALDRFPKRRDPAELVAEALVTAGYPNPTEVVANRVPILAGAPHFRGRVVRRHPDKPGKPVFHAWVRFGQPVSGPVLAGSLRYRGLGLFLPLDEQAPSKAARPGEPASPHPERELVG